MGRGVLQDLGASEVGSKVWVLTIEVLEVNGQLDTIRAQCRRARSALFCRVDVIHPSYIHPIRNGYVANHRIHVFQHSRLHVVFFANK